MKNISVLAILVIILLVIFPNNQVFCQDSENQGTYSFAIGTQFGFVHGLALEFVYPNPGEIKNDILSELRWDMKPVFYFGYIIDIQRRDLLSAPGFFTSISFKTGIPGDSGILEDRDWKSNEHSNVTHFSSHTNKTRDFFWVDITAGASIPLNPVILKTFLSGSWMHFSFTGRDGYTLYNGIYNPYSGEAIRYKQDWFLIAAGVSAGINIFSNFYADLSFQISPFTYCVSKDEHLDIGKTFTYLDYTGWGLFLDPKASISYTLKNAEFSFEMAYRYIGKTRGPSFVDTTGNEIYAPNGEAGAGLQLLNSRFLVRVWL